MLSWLKVAGYIGSRTYSFTGDLPVPLALPRWMAPWYLEATTTIRFEGRSTRETLGPARYARLMVQVTDIHLNFPNGTNSSITPGESVNTCIVPEFPAVMSLPSLFYSNFERLTNTARLGQSVGINYGGILYPPNAV
jgi:hypothetical protein